MKKSILSKTGGVGNLEVGEIDLSSIASINLFVEEIKKNYTKVDVLIHSAGTGSTRMTEDGYVLAMEVNVMGPALLTNELSPLLQGGRVISVAAATYGQEKSWKENFTVSDLVNAVSSVDKDLNATGDYFGFSKYLMTHWALELASRENNITSFAVNPGYALQIGPVPNWILKLVPKEIMPAGPASRI